MTVVRTPAGGENIVRIVPIHWTTYAVPTFVCASLFAASLILLYATGVGAYHYSPSAIQLLLLFSLALLLAAFHSFFFFLLGNIQSKIIITNKRTIRLKERLLFEDDLLEVSYDWMRTIEARKTGFLHNLLNYGSLHFDQGVSMESVPRPNTVAREIEQQVGMK